MAVNKNPHSVRDYIVRKKVAKNILHTTGCRRIRNQFCAAIKETIPRFQALSGPPYVKVELLIERKSEVETFRYYGHDKTGYAICPNCGYAMEREYQKHCEECGQLLSWIKSVRGEVKIQRLTGPTEKKENAIRPVSLESTHFM